MKKATAEEVLQLCSEMNDKDVALTLGISRERVRQYRRKLGIQSFSQRRRQEVLPYLGTDTDENIGKRFGLTGGAIHLLRKRLGIPRYQHKVEDTIPQEAKELFGKVSDLKIARQFNLNRGAVNRARQALGIPACKGNRWHGSRIDELPKAEQNLVGKITDREFAERHNLTIGCVATYRKAHGIKASKRQA